MEAPESLFSYSPPPCHQEHVVQRDDWQSNPDFPRKGCQLPVQMLPTAHRWPGPYWSGGQRIQGATSSQGKCTCLRTSVPCPSPHPRCERVGRVGGRAGVGTTSAYVSTSSAWPALQHPWPGCSFTHVRMGRGFSGLNRKPLLMFIYVSIFS